MSVHFSLQLNTLQILRVPKGVTVKRLKYGERGGCTSKTKYLRTYIDMAFFLVWCGALTPEVYPSI